MTDARSRRSTVVAAIGIVAGGICAAVWWSGPYSSTATIQITSTDTSRSPDTTGEPGTLGSGAPALSAVVLSLDGFGPTEEVTAELAKRSGGYASDYTDMVSITPISERAGLTVTATASNRREAAEVANDAADIVIEQFNATTTVPEAISFRAIMIDAA
jgi:capsular polysaccharide biosynthesis protein